MWRGCERMSLATLGYRIAERRRGVAGIVQNEQGYGAALAVPTRRHSTSRHYAACPSFAWSLHTGRSLHMVTMSPSRLKNTYAR